MLSPEYYSKLDPNYREVLLKLETELKESKSRQNQSALLNFMGKHMMPQELWNLTPKILRRSDNNKLAYWFLPFCFGEAADDRKYYDKKMYYRDFIANDILFPAKYLTRRMEEYEKQIYSFIPPKIRQRHEEMKALYVKIKDAEGDINEWFAALLEANDHQFVKDNVEIRLGMDLTDKNLWKKYINYLKKHDFKILLETYSKCVRFFTDDAEIMDEYRRAAIKYGHRVPVPWGNPYSIEVYDNEFWNSRDIEQKVRNSFGQHSNISSVNEPLTIHFDGQNAAKPDFPFLSPTIRYILDNANGEVLQKLFKICKWFRASQPVNVCYKFEEYGYGQNQHIEIKEQSIISYNNSVLHYILDQIFVSTFFYFSSANPNALSELIPRIYRCTAKYVEIEKQNLSLEELQFLVGNAVELDLSNVRDSDGKEFKLEDILQLTPKIKLLRLSHVLCSAETCQKLCELEFQNKLDYIFLFNMKTDLLDPVKFAEFVKKRCSAKAYISIYVYLEDGNVEYVERFRQVLSDAIKEKWDADEMPVVKIVGSSAV